MWKSGGVVVDYQAEAPVRAFSASSSAAGTPAAGAGRETPLSLSPRASSPRGVWSGGQPSLGGGGGDGGGGGSVVTVKVVFAPHQLMHSRTCVDQVRFGSPFSCCKY